MFGGLIWGSWDHHIESQQASLLVAQRAVAVALSLPWLVLKKKIIQKIIYLLLNMDTYGIQYVIWKQKMPVFDYFQY